MNNLSIDIGYRSINHYGELLCGDHVEIVEKDDNNTIIVLADGLGSGVKASILSTLTSKIISTMMGEGISLEECVETVAATLPICSERGVAYSTFTIIHLIDNERVKIIQYDNPNVICLRNGTNYDYPKTEIIMGNKKIYKSKIKLQENDIFIAMSDGCPHAGLENNYNMDWQIEDITKFMEAMSIVGYTAKNLAKMLIKECYKLYGEKPRDDATACVVKIMKRQQINVLFGPPFNSDDAYRMMSLFFSKEGKHIVCGGTTSSIASKYLKKPIKLSANIEEPNVPPISYIEGVDLVTEGIVTVNKVLEYAKDYLGDNQEYENWSIKRDGASLMCRLLFEEATDINFYVGRAINPAHQNAGLQINFNIKMTIVEELVSCLEKMGKKIKVSYF